MHIFCVWNVTILDIQHQARAYCLNIHGYVFLHRKEPLGSPLKVYEYGRILLQPQNIKCNKLLIITFFHAVNIFRRVCVKSYLLQDYEMNKVHGIGIVKRMLAYSFYLVYLKTKRQIQLNKYNSHFTISVVRTKIIRSLW